MVDKEIMEFCSHCLLERDSSKLKSSCAVASRCCCRNVVQLVVDMQEEHDREMEFDEAVKAMAVFAF